MYSPYASRINFDFTIARGTTILATYRDGREERLADNPNNKDAAWIQNKLNIYSVRIYDESVIAYNILNNKWDFPNQFEFL